MVDSQGVAQAYTRWLSGELRFAVILAFLGATFTEWIGIHAIFGAFLVGAAIGDSSHLREHTRVTIDHFVSFIFAKGEPGGTGN
jgi:Kef-type K+ transport system membrane component KefB